MTTINNLSETSVTFGVRTRVRVEGHDEVFLVVHVCPEQCCADLACVERIGFLVNVPLDKLRPIAKNIKNISPK